MVTRPRFWGRGTNDFITRTAAAPERTEVVYDQTQTASQEATIA